MCSLVRQPERGNRDARITCLFGEAGVYTGQRIDECTRIDCAELLDGTANDEPLALMQQKTGVEMFIPIQPDRGKIVKAYPSSDHANMVFYDRIGRSFPTPDQIHDRLRKFMIDLDHQDDVPIAGVVKRETCYKFHVPRKFAACHLAEVEATRNEIGSIGGMDIQTVMEYTRHVTKRKLARGTASRMNTIKPGRERPDHRLRA